MRNPYLVSLFLFLNLNVLSACGEDGLAVTVGDVVFDDPELQRCYDFNSSRYPDDWDVSAVEQMFCGDLAYNIRNLTGIGALKGLRGLNLLGQSNIRGYSPLSELHQLTVLELRDTSVENKDLETISQLLQLTWLDLDGTALGDVSRLGLLTKLEHISLVDAQVSSGIYSLSNVEDLRQGFFNGNPESPCVDLEALRLAFPDALIEPAEPVSGISCSE